MIGQCGVKPSEYWQLSEAEVIGIIAGHQRLESYDAEKFRNIYGAVIRAMGEKGNVKKFWQLPTDYDNAQQRTKEYLDKRNAAALEYAKKIGFFKN